MDETDEAPASMTYTFSADTDGPHGPIRNSQAKRRDATHIPRPPNAFILFRSSFIREHNVSPSVEGNHSNLSKIIGKYWRALPKSEREAWEAKALQAQLDHRRRFPDWRFSPGANAAANAKTKRYVVDSGGGNAGRMPGSTSIRGAKDPPDELDTEDDGDAGDDDDDDSDYEQGQRRRKGKGKASAKVKRKARPSRRAWSTRTRTHASTRAAHPSQADERIDKIADLLVQGKKGAELEQALEQWENDRLSQRPKSDSKPPDLSSSHAPPLSVLSPTATHTQGIKRSLSAPAPDMRVGVHEDQALLGHGRTRKRHHSSVSVSVGDLERETVSLMRRARRRSRPCPPPMAFDNPPSTGGSAPAPAGDFANVNPGNTTDATIVSPPAALDPYYPTAAWEEQQPENASWWPFHVPMTNTNTNAYEPTREGSFEQTYDEYAYRPAYAYTAGVGADVGYGEVYGDIEQRYLESFDRCAPAEREPERVRGSEPAGAGAQQAWSTACSMDSRTVAPPSSAAFAVPNNTAAQTRRVPADAGALFCPPVPASSFSSLMGWDGTVRGAGASGGGEGEREGAGGGGKMGHGHGEAQAQAWFGWGRMQSVGLGGGGWEGTGASGGDASAGGGGRGAGGDMRGG